MSHKLYNFKYRYLHKNKRQLNYNKSQTMYIGQVYNKWNVIGHASEAGSKRQAPKIKIFSLDSRRISRNKM